MTGIFGALRLPASVIFGSGQRAAIGLMTAQIGKRALICTDARMGGDAQFKAIVADIEANGVEIKVYDRTEADLPMDGISGCVAECADFKPDVVLGIGGGSCMDMAKCVAVLLQHGGSLRDYYGENKIPGPVAPVIAVPTTSGTGSEVTPVAVIADTERGTKVGISSPYLIPRVAVCDPELTLTCPPGLTAGQRRRCADPCHRKLHRRPPRGDAGADGQECVRGQECAQRHLRSAGAARTSSRPCAPR